MKTNEKSASDNILFIDTSTDQSMVKLLRNGKVVDEKFWAGHGDLSETLLTKTQELLRNNKLKLSNLDQIAVNLGPGSYTGLRIGVTTANFLAWSLNLPIIAATIYHDKLSFIRVKKQQFILPKYQHPAYITRPRVARKD